MVKRLTMANIWLISSWLTSWSVMFTALLGQYMYQLRAWWRDWVRSSTFLCGRDCRLSQSHPCFSTITGHIPSFLISVCLCISLSLSLSLSLPPLSVSSSNLSLSLSLSLPLPSHSTPPSLSLPHPLPFPVPFSVRFYVPFLHCVPPSLLQPLLPSVNKSDVTLSGKLLTVAASSQCSDSVTRYATLSWLMNLICVCRMCEYWMITPMAPCTVPHNNSFGSLEQEKQTR